MRGLIRGGVVLTALLVGGRAVVNSSVTRARGSGQLRIKSIEIRGNKALSPAEIKAAAGAKEGAALLDVSPEDMAAKLRAHPALADAGVRRVLPGTLVLTVREREPLALLLAGEALLAVDAEGAAFPAGKDIFRMALPVLRGLPLQDSRVEAEAWAEALGSLQESARVGLDVSELLWEKDELDLVTLDGDRVRTLPAEFRVLTRVKWVLEKERSLGRRGLELDARAEDMVTVRVRAETLQQGGGA